MSSKAIANNSINCNLISRINLSNNNIGDDGLKYISNFIKKSISIISLDISSNNISHEGSNHLFESIANHQSLVEINISNNNHIRKNHLRSKGCEKLTNFFKTNSKY